MMCSASSLGQVMKKPFFIALSQPDDMWWG
jgi:hypothetical protein